MVIDLDGPEARAWWESTGIGDSTAVVYSPRKDGGRHHYFRIYDVEISNSKSKLAPGVDVRGEGGLAIGPGCFTPDGMYVGDLTNIPDAPAELLAILPEKSSFSVASEEEIAELERTEHAAEPSESELQDISHIQANLLALPRVWAEGAGWHDTVFRSSCWLWRMVRTPSYAITEGEAIDLMLNSTPTYPNWGDEEILRQWESARESTRGQYADPPTEALPAMLDFIEVANQLPQLAPVSGRVFLDLLGDESTKPAKLIEEALISGLNEHQAVSLVHGAKCGELLRTDYGVRKLWRDVGVAAKKVTSSTIVRVDHGFAEIEVQPTAPVKRQEEVIYSRGDVTLLSEAERGLVRTASWWGTDYLEWAESIVTAFNAPYHRLNRWMVLSLILSTVGKIPLEGGRDRFLNLFGFVLGETTTGKSEALEIAMTAVSAYFSDEDDPDLGGDASAQALGKKLIERDGRSSLFRKDEAHGLIAQMKNPKSHLAPLMTSVTELYDCRVPKMLRTMDRESSGKNATSFFSLHFMGTYEGLTDVLEPSDWASGFLPRCVWAIGNKHEINRDAMRLPIRRAGKERDVDVRAMQKQWAAQFRSIQNRLAPDYSPVDMDFDDAVLERHLTLQERLYRIADELPGFRERLYPTAKRMGLNILKAACLVALSDGRTKVQMVDLLIAIEQGEEWVENVLHMVKATDSTPFVRAVGKLEQAIDDAGRELRVEDVYRRADGRPKRETDTLIAQLIAEGRAKREIHPNTGVQMIRLIGDHT